MSTPQTTPLGRLAMVFALPAGVALACWVYLAMMIGDMSIIPGMRQFMMQPQSMGLLPMLGLFWMWAVMMAAMMLPTAVPMIAAYARMQASDRATGASIAPVAMFAGGYVLAWALFSIGAGVLQAWLTKLAFISPMMMKTMSDPVSAAILIAAGLYQFTSVKQRCLKQCQTPMTFLLTQWRPGNFGALTMGTRHGVFCVGCCWALMALLFVTGVMNTVWIIVIAAYVLIEKLTPPNLWLSRITGAGLIFAGSTLII